MNTFSMVLNPQKQSPSIQDWLLQHADDNFAEDSPNDGIVTHSYQTEDHLFLDKVVFQVEGMTIQRMRYHLIFRMLYNRFNWSQQRAEQFYTDFGQLLEIELPGLGSIYYAHMLDIDSCEIRCDFYEKGETPS